MFNTAIIICFVILIPLVSYLALKENTENIEMLFRFSKFVLYSFIMIGLCACADEFTTDIIPTILMIVFMVEAIYNLTIFLKMYRVFREKIIVEKNITV